MPENTERTPENAAEQGDDSARKNIWTFVIAGLVAIVLLVYLFSFTVQAGKVGVKYRFGRMVDVYGPGIHFQWPYPVETVDHLDDRIRLVETKVQESLTQDSFNLNVKLSAGWKILDPARFLERLESVEEAEKNLLTRLENVRRKALGEFDLSDLINTDFEFQQKRFAAFENRMKELLDEELAEADWGVDIRYLGVKHLSFASGPATEVINRMKAERSEKSERYRKEGESIARQKKAEARTEAAEIIADGRLRAGKIRGRADATAAEHYAVFKENPELATFLEEIETLRSVLKKRTTVMVRTDSGVFRLLEQDAAPRIPVNDGIEPPELDKEVDDE